MYLAGVAHVGFHISPSAVDQGLHNEQVSILVQLVVGIFMCTNGYMLLMVPAQFENPILSKPAIISRCEWCVRATAPPLAKCGTAPGPTEPSRAVSLFLVPQESENPFYTPKSIRWLVGEPRPAHSTRFQPVVQVEIISLRYCTHGKDTRGGT